ncbi:hypothetical protein HMPREF1990_00654 [Porphyromonas gingivalis W4087]|nr:hypothetical protein HMPREF1988_00810 [Porphyromonas gingivalis F0185]ERJ90152.1 hypothetical protein HMPREF1990_00654 [Porphyromonas gingivalis W4087]
MESFQISILKGSRIQTKKGRKSNLKKYGNDLYINEFRFIYRSFSFYI